MFTLRKLINFKLSPQIRQIVSDKREVKVMKKIMAGRDKGRRRWHYEEFPKMVTVQKLSSAGGQGKEANRRITVLNKLFMKNVTDLMSTGVYAEVLYGYGIQISTVKVTSDFKKLNIFWTSSGVCDDEVDRRLKSIAGPLRHELSVLRLMGEIPQINFCRDKSLAMSAKVDYLIRRADFGEDFVPTDPTLFIRNETKLETKLSDEVKRKIRELDQEKNDEGFEVIPQMRHDIYGLDHDRIMKSVMASMSKSAKAWESYGSKETTKPIEIRETVNFDRLKKDAELREGFIKFLEKKQQEKKITPERKKSHRIFYDEDTSFDMLENSYKDELLDSDFLEDDK